LKNNKIFCLEIHEYPSHPAIWLKIFDEISGDNRQRLIDYRKVKEKEREDFRAAKIAKDKVTDTGAGIDNIDTTEEAKSRLLKSAKPEVPEVVKENKQK
jgi:hypothetical protein